MKQLKQMRTRLEEVQLKFIDASFAHQTREKMCSKTISTYVTDYRNNADMPPLLVAERQTADGPEGLILLDGFHRYKALHHCGRETTIVKIIEVPQETTHKELRWIGGRENLKNGLPLRSRQDRINLFKAYIGAKQHKQADGRKIKSYRDIAEEIQIVSHQTISNWMRTYYPAIAAKMARDNPEELEPASGTGPIRHDVDMENRERAMFYEGIVEHAKALRPDERQPIYDEIRKLLNRLEAEAPVERDYMDF